MGVLQVGWRLQTYRAILKNDKEACLLNKGYEHKNIRQNGKVAK